MVKINVKKVKFLMYKHELNHRELAELSELSRERITKILNGSTTVRKTTAEKIAKALKVEMIEIIRGGD